MTEFVIPQDLLPPELPPYGLPYPDDAWNEVIAHPVKGSLWIGGQLKAGETYPQQHVKVRDEFDAVYSFYWDEDGNGPDEGVNHYHYPIPDGELSEHQLTTVRAFAIEIAFRSLMGEKVLVRSQAGYNRSALVLGFALIELGWEPRWAIQVIRAKRSPWALSNMDFLRYLLEAEDEFADEGDSDRVLGGGACGLDDAGDRAGDAADTVR